MQSRAEFVDKLGLSFVIYCDEKGLSKDEREELLYEIINELEYQVDSYER